MIPIGPLIREHKIMERMIGSIKKEVLETSRPEDLEQDSIDVVVDFFRIYADKCHHGKEEDILFTVLTYQY